MVTFFQDNRFLVHIANDHAQLAVRIRWNDLHPFKFQFEGMLEFGLQCSFQLFLGLFLCPGGILGIMYALYMDLFIAFLNKADLQHILAVGDDRRDFKEGRHFTGPVPEEIVHTALHAGDHADTVFDFGCTFVTNHIIDQRDIRLVQRGNYDLALLCHMAVIVHDIDHKGILMDRILGGIKQLDHAGTGFSRTIGIDDTWPKNLMKDCPGGIIDLFTCRCVKFC